jgi:hypothetical protein
MPALWGSKAKKDELIKDMLNVYRCARTFPDCASCACRGLLVNPQRSISRSHRVACLFGCAREVKRTHRLPPGDFPDLERFKETLKDHDFDTFAKLDEKLVSRIDDVLGP